MWRIIKCSLRFTAYATTVGEGDDFKTVTKIVSNLLQRYQSPRPGRKVPQSQAAAAVQALARAPQVEPQAIEAVYSVLVSNLPFNYVGGTSHHDSFNLRNVSRYFAGKTRSLLSTDAFLMRGLVLYLLLN